MEENIDFILTRILQFLAQYDINLTDQDINFTYEFDQSFWNKDNTIIFASF